jgi:hypothetical protein
MSIEAIATATMDNHLHVLLKTRPDLVKKWSDREVARRWLTVCPGESPADPLSPPVKPAQEQIDELLKDEEKIKECRRRLSSLSWMMKLLKEPIARFANAEDSCTGAFFEGRFRSTRLLDIYALVLCSMYVDLNPIRSGKARTPEASYHTSAYRRIQARQARSRDNRRNPSVQTNALAAAWLSPIDEDGTAPDGPQAKRGRRVSDRGFLPMTLDKYLMLLDWSGRQLRRGKRGAIPDHLASILDRLDLAVEHWIEGVQSFQSWFADFAGRPETLRSHAERHGILRIRGMR